MFKPESSNHPLGITETHKASMTSEFELFEHSKSSKCSSLAVCAIQLRSHAPFPVPCRSWSQRCFQVLRHDLSFRRLSFPRVLRPGITAPRPTLAFYDRQAYAPIKADRSNEIPMITALQRSKTITREHIATWFGTSLKPALNPVQCEEIALKLNCFRWPGDPPRTYARTTYEDDADRWWDFDEVTDAANLLQQT